MRTCRLAATFAGLLLLMTAVPALAGGPNDNGNGYRQTYRSEYIGTTTGYFFVCRDGEDSGEPVIVPNSTQTEILTGWEKPDGSGNRNLLEKSVVAPDGSYKFESWLLGMTNSLDTEGANATGVHVMMTWSDPQGIYAYGKGVVRTSQNEAGEVKADIWNISGQVCIRDTITP